MLDIINKIKGIETEAETIKRQAQQQSIAASASAHSEGKQLVADRKIHAHKAAEKNINAAQQAADELVNQRIAQATARCEALTNTANSRLDKAADLIVGRIVGSI